MSRFSMDWSEFSLQVMITFAHFLWQACVVGLVLFVAQHVVESLRGSVLFQLFRVSKKSVSLGETDLRGANIRYAIACTAFFSLPICVIATFAWVHQSRGPIVMVASGPVASPSSLIASANEAIPTMANTDIPVLPGQATPMDVDVFATEPIEASTLRVKPQTSPVQRIELFAPYLLLAYIVGVCFMLARFLSSIIGSSRLRRTIQPITDLRLLQTIAEQCARIGLKRVPLVALCQRVTVPVVVGIVKPMILLPPTLLCGLDPNQIAAILSHELAHIRRYDLIVNLLQRVVEALLFFHPVAWWISRRISVERENCCDDVAAACMGRLPYAGALLQMAELCIGNDRERSAALTTLAASGGNSTDLGYRIRRLIGAEETTRVGFSRRSVVVGLALISLVTISLVAWGQSQDTGKKAVASVAENPANNQGTGSLTGKITVDGVVPKLPKLRVRTSASPWLSTRATDEERKKYEASLVEIDDESIQVDADQGLANAFVYLAKAPAEWQPTKADLTPVALTMQDYRFEPRAAIIRVDQDVRLINSGVSADNFHFEPRDNGAQNRLVMEGTEFTFERPFKSPEKTPIQAKSDMNIWKMTYLLPLDHPFAAVTDKQGRFSIDGLPPGTHTFQIWHERTGWLEKSLNVKIQAGQTTEVNRPYGLEILALETQKARLSELLKYHREALIAQRGKLEKERQSLQRKNLVNRIEAAIAQRDKASKDSRDYPRLNHWVQIKELHLAQFDFENGVAGIDLPDAPEATPERLAELRELLRFRWGLPVDGIQVGIARTDDRFRFTAGEKIPFQLFIRNITQEPITQSLRWCDAKNMTASLRRLAGFDTDKNIFLSLRPNSVTLQPTELRLEPGVTMELPLGQFEMDTVGLHSGVYHVDGHFPVVFPNQEGELATRVATPVDSSAMPHDLFFRFELVGTQPTPQNKPADELKEVAEYADIEWGKTIYGLQAGTRYRNNDEPDNKADVNNSEAKVEPTQRPIRIGDTIKTEVLVRNVSDQPITVRFHPAAGSEVQLLAAMQSNLTEVASRNIMRRTDVPITHDIDRTVERTLQPSDVFVAAQQDFEIQLLLDGRERPLDLPNANRHWVKGSGDYTYTAYLKLSITDSLSVGLHSGRLKMSILADENPLGSNQRASVPRELGGSNVDADLSEISGLITAVKTIPQELNDSFQKVHRKLTPAERLKSVKLLAVPDFVMQHMLSESSYPYEEKVALLSELKDRDFNHLEFGLQEWMWNIARDYAKVDPAATREWLAQFKNAEYGVGMGLTEVLQAAKQQDSMASLKILRGLSEPEAECLVNCGEIPDYDLSASDWLKEVEQFQSQRLRTYLLKRDKP